MALFLVVALLFFVPVEDGGLPVRAWYPFDTTKYPWHAVGYFIEACSVSFGLTAIMGMDSLHTNLCNLFLVQLGILNEHFKSCGSNEQDDFRYEISSSSTIKKRNREEHNYNLNEIRRGNDDFVEQFRTSIRHHQRLLAIIGDFNKVFSAAMFVQMLSSTSMICLTGFQAILVSHYISQSAVKLWSEPFFRLGRGPELQHHQVCDIPGGGRLAALLHLLGRERSDIPGVIISSGRGVSTLGLFLLIFFYKQHKHDYKRYIFIISCFKKLFVYQDIWK